jgi:uroporphyrinogen-III synthase
MRVIVTRPAAEAAEWIDALRHHGFEAVSLPLIEIYPPAGVQALRDAWNRIAGYRAAMFVSANAVRGFFAEKAAGEAFTPRAWATGPGTRNALLASGVAAGQVDCPPPESPQFDSEALWRVVGSQCKRADRVLLVRGGGGRDWLERQLAANGVQAESLDAYRRVAPDWTPASRAIAESAISDAWVFSSSEGVRNVAAAFPGRWAHAQAVATHPRIAQAARDAGFGVVCESRPAVEDVTRALESLA